ncbi:MAG: hypothetical protein P9M06_07415 [Candidatus Saelkia tenebricola]|nr:hypothetical protein [Candidatus Saelkia tenebricola]
MRKFKVILFILAVIFMIGVFYNLTGTAVAAGKLTLGDKIDGLILKQEQVLKKLDQVYEELLTIKIRLTRSLN